MELSRAISTIMEMLCRRNKYAPPFVVYYLFIV
nr:MAG TPA: hypothetical protein [Caudoviricetes sp.]